MNLVSREHAPLQRGTVMFWMKFTKPIDDTIAINVTGPELVDQRTAPTPAVRLRRLIG